MSPADVLRQAQTFTASLGEWRVKRREMREGKATPELPAQIAALHGSWKDAGVFLSAVARDWGYDPGRLDEFIVRPDHDTFPRARDLVADLEYRAKADMECPGFPPSVSPGRYGAKETLELAKEIRRWAGYLDILERHKGVAQDERIRQIQGRLKPMLAICLRAAEAWNVKDAAALQRYSVSFEMYWFQAHRIVEEVIARAELEALKESLTSTEAIAKF